MHHGTEREIRIEAGLRKLDWRGRGWRRLGVAEIGT
jgi:hypothetical protein